MKTDEFIARLSADVRPMPRLAAIRLIAIAAALGVAVSAVVLLNWLGLRPDWRSAAADPALRLKLAFVISVGLAALAGVRQLGRPEGRLGHLWWLLLAPFGVMVAIGALEIARVAPDQRLRVWLGYTWSACPFRILALSTPITLALLWPLRTRFAPTRPAMAGLVAGLGAGGLGAAVYALYCTERAAAFMATWYGLGILLAGLLGALLSARLLRW